MKKVSSLLAALTVLCLMCSLPGAALAQTAEKPLDSAETVGWPPELIGSWVGLHENLWGQFTFLQNGNFIMTVFEDPSLDKIGSSETIEKADRITVQGNLMRLTVRGTTSTFRHVPEYYIRLQEKDESISESVDRMLVGSWGGRIGEDYTEWTFRGDGQFARLTPYQALNEEGYYIAGRGNLAILLNGKIISCTYKASESFITLDLPDIEKVTLNMRPGQLTGMSIDEDGDFGWMFSLELEESRWPVACRYFGIETEVGIPGVVAYCAVLGIGDGAFKGNKTVQSVTVPDFVTDIGSSTFEGCESLKDVLFIGTRTDMGNEVWKGDLSSYNSVGLTVIPGSCPLKTIGEGAFRGCVHLENLNIAESAVQSPHSTRGWIGRSDVKGINIPDGVTGIGANAFEGCESITSVTIPGSVKEIGKDAFKGCDRVTFIVAEGSYAYNYAKRNGIPFMLKGE